MEYQLQLTPFVQKEGWKYKVIQLTDITLHTTPKRPSSIVKKVVTALKFMKPGRIYAPISYADPVTPSENKTTVVDLIKQDPAFVKMIREEEKNGYKVLLSVPKEIPVFAGKDSVEFAASLNGRRIFRGFAKNNPSS